MSTYKAIITPIVNIRPHSNADRLVLGTAAGHQVIVSSDTVEGTLGIFFPEDGQLSLEMCKQNNLHRHSELNADPSGKAGFFDDNRRVRAQRLRKEMSMGFWTELSVLEWTKHDLSKLKKGDLISDLAGHDICNKYYTPATRRMMGSGQGTRKDKQSAKRILKESFPEFYEHFSTQKLRMMADMIPSGAILSISEKCHGTSARTGHLRQIMALNFFKKAWNRIFGEKFKTSAYKYVSGSRRVVLDPNKVNDGGYYSGKEFRSVIHSKIKDLGLYQGETLYYEIVGFSEDGAKIMGDHKVEDKKLKKQYGDRMVYKYGCDSGTYKILVYRITQTGSDGRVLELPWTQMTTRCRELGLTAVPQLKEPFIYDGDSTKLLELCEALSQGSSLLDSDHIREGVVLRVEAPGVDTHYKYKSFWFCELEGIAKNSDEYVDPEEIS